MFNKLIISVGMVLGISGAAHAEWTGDATEGMVSGVTITKLHSGQIDGGPYFCIEAVRAAGDGTIRACQLERKSIWRGAYDLLYNQTMYYYSTGQLVRVYYDPDVWSYKPFNAALTSNALVGYSTCTSSDDCFGPDRKK